MSLVDDTTAGLTGVAPVGVWPPTVARFDRPAIGFNNDVMFGSPPFGAGRLPRRFAGTRSANKPPPGELNSTGIVEVVPCVGVLSCGFGGPPTPYGPGRVVPNGRLPVKSLIPLSSPVGIATTRLVPNVAGFGKYSGLKGVGTPGGVLRS